MPSAKTEITEIVTGLAISGEPTLETALATRAVVNVSDDIWERLIELERSGQHRQEFAAAWANGRAFLAAADGLRGRPPRVVEWKGPTQSPGDEVVPADLRIDHVWLVSCKYLSKVLANAAPARLFDRGLAGARAAPPAIGTPTWRSTPTRSCMPRCASSWVRGPRCHRTPST